MNGKLVAVILLSTVCLVQGYKSYNEVCEYDPTNPTNPNNCHPSEYLICGGRKLCECQNTLVWQHALQKCTFAVERGCTDAFGSPGWPGSGGDGGHHGGNGPSPGCPLNANCNTGSGKCECAYGYTPSADSTECNGAEKIHLGITSILSLTLFYFLSMKLFL